MLPVGLRTWRQGTTPGPTAPENDDIKKEAADVTARANGLLAGVHFLEKEEHTFIAHFFLLINITRQRLQS